MSFFDEISELIRVRADSGSFSGVVALEEKGERILEVAHGFAHRGWRERADVSLSGTGSGSGGAWERQRMHRRSVLGVSRPYCEPLRNLNGRTTS